MTQQMRILYPNCEGKDKEAFQRLQMAYDYLMKRDTKLAIKFIRANDKSLIPHRQIAITI